MGKRGSGEIGHWTKCPGIFVNTGKQAFLGVNRNARSSCPMSDFPIWHGISPFDTRHEPEELNEIESFVFLASPHKRFYRQLK